MLSIPTFSYINGTLAFDIEVISTIYYSMSYRFIDITWNGDVMTLYYKWNDMEPDSEILLLIGLQYRFNVTGTHGYC